MFRGWCVKHGIEVTTLSPSAFLDLVHVYILKFTKSEDHEQVTSQLIGPPRITRPTLVDERTGIVPPTWWKGDAYASNSGVAAMLSMKR